MPSSLLAETVAAHGENRPHHTALHFDDRAVTYGRLNDLTGSLRAHLARLRLPAGSTVCVPAHKNPQTIALLLAVFREGHIALAPSPSLGSAALERLAHQARVSHLLTAADDGALTALPVRAERSEAEGFAVPDPARTQLLLTTSGSTGTPKIVPIETAGFDAFADWAVDEFALAPDETALSYAPLNFDLALLDVWTFLRLGSSVVLVEQQRATDAAHLAALVSRHDVTFVQGVPMMYRLLLEGGGTFAAVRHAVFTGDRMPVDLLRRVPPAFPGPPSTTCSAARRPTTPSSTASIPPPWTARCPSAVPSAAPTPWSSTPRARASTRRAPVNSWCPRRSRPGATSGRT